MPSVVGAWTGIAAPTPRDWLGLFVPGVIYDGSRESIEWVYVSGSKTPDVALAAGSVTMPLTDIPAGTYELRLFANDGTTVLAISNSFVCGATIDAPPYCTAAALDSIDEYGIAHGWAQPPGAQVKLIVDDNDQSNMTIATSGADGRFDARLLVTGGTHHASGLLLPQRAGDGSRTETIRFDRSNTQQPMPPKPKAPPGLAAKYTNDNGLGTDPDVVFYVDFSDPNWPARYFNSGGVVELPERPVDTDPVSGLPRVNMQYTPDGRFTPCYRSHDFLKAHEAQPDELYYRYYLRLKPGYQCSLQPKKLPGLAGRGDPPLYGAGGNGGDPCTGRKDADGLHSWSARNLALEAPAADWMIPIGTYLYQADMVANYGDTHLWDAPWLVADQDYCVEQYVKMNTIDLSAPDGYGNGVGNYDGILRCWLNDELVFERTNLRFRHHPEIHVNEVWMDHFHGGTTPPEVAHPFAHWGMVAARQRIGMINTGLVANVISNNTIHQANPCIPDRDGTGFCNYSGEQGMAHGIVADWCSGIWNPDTKTLFSVGGGETFPGAAMGFDKATGLWSPAYTPTTADTRPPLNFANDPNFDRKWCLFSDGVAAVGHTYDTVAWVPAAWGITGPKGGIMLSVRQAVYGVGSTHRPVICDLDTKQWHKAASEGSEGIAQTTSLNNGGGNTCVLDAPNRRYLLLAGAVSQMACDRIATLTFADTSGIGVQGHGPIFPELLLPRYPVQVAVPEKRKIAIMGAALSGQLLIQMYDADKLDGIVSVPWQGDAPYGNAGIGLTWCAWAGCFMALPCHAPDYSGTHADVIKPVVELFRIVPDWSGKPWTISRVPITGAWGYTSNFTAKRFVADESDQTVNWVSNYDGPVYSLRIT